MIHFNTNEPTFWSDITCLQQFFTRSDTLATGEWQTLVPTFQGEFLYNLPEINSAPFQAWRAA